MKQNLEIALVQTSLAWEEPVANRTHIKELIGDIKDVDIIVLPEMFTTGFTMAPERLAEEDGRETVGWLQQIAREKRCAVTGSAAVSEGGAYFNRLFFVSADGTVHWYDKRHLFRMGGEQHHYRAGTRKIVVEIEGWRICPLVCYDLRFPVWSRNIFNSKDERWQYDVLIYVANWPEVRSHAWRHLLVARAIENQCYVVGVNRVGNDGNGYGHSGDSVALNARGLAVSQIPTNAEGVYRATLDAEALVSFRRQFPAGLDADEFTIIT